MYQLVRDEVTGFEEWIDFIPVQSWNTAEHIHDDQNNRLGFVDHVNGQYPSRAELFGYDDKHIPIRDRSFLIKPTFKNVCDPVISQLNGHRDFSIHMKRSFLDINKKRDYFSALSAVQSASERLYQNGYSSTMSDDQIKDFANDKADTLRLKLSSMTHDTDACFAYVEHYLSRFGLAFREEEVKNKQSTGELYALVNRACDPIWWRRQLRRKCALNVELAARDLELVQKHKQVYCSDFSVNRMRERNKSNEIALKETIAYDEDDPNNFFTLHELSAKSVSNPEIRRAEMFTRLRGFEELSKELEHDSVFFTVTSPSRFHAVSKGQVNQKWLEAGSPTAKDAHKYLMRVFEAFRKSIDKQDVKVYGMRIAEPHQDGTPHHHFLFFMKPEHKDFVISEFQRFAMLDSPDESGAKKHRFKAELIDKDKSAVGYIAKYLSKNIDGQHIAKDRNSNLDGVQAAERVVTWARVNQIRQFQFIGSPPVTVWRELRRVREEFKQDDAMFTDLTEVEHLALENVRRAADSGDWKAFCIAMGGIAEKNADAPLRTVYSVPDCIEKLIESGEYYATKYGDKAQARISGLMFKQVFVATRFRTWKTENKEVFLKASKKIMGGVVDWFDALEREQEYQRMAEERYQQYLDFMSYKEELELYAFDSFAFEAAYSSGCSAQPDS